MKFYILFFLFLSFVAISVLAWPVPLADGQTLDAQGAKNNLTLIGGGDQINAAKGKGKDDDDESGEEDKDKDKDKDKKKKKKGKSKEKDDKDKEKEDPSKALFKLINVGNNKE